jgi:glucose/arabinose dehydrogenase
MPILKCVFVSARFAAASLFLLSSSTLAHPPHDPFDNTRFAPITRFGPNVGIEVLATGLTAPLKGVAAPGDPDHLYVVDQPGRLWAINTATGNKTVILDVSARLVQLGVCGRNTFDERGFLGVAFHPDFARNGRLYTYTSEPVAGPPTFRSTVPGGVTPDHQNVVAEWSTASPGRNGSTVNPRSRRELLRVDWPQFNHDAGDMAFGPDGMLYISMGDGGGADDADGQSFVTAPPHHPECGEAPIVGHQGNGNGQKLNTPLGKILRIDVDKRDSANHQYGIPADNPFVGTPGAVQEIWAFGFRNPYRFSFDGPTGNLIVGDVGQNDIEEVDVVVRGGNYGWNVKEGTTFFHINGNDPGFASRSPDPTRTVPRGLIDPIAEYDIHHEGHSVIGGYIYRGTALSALRGQYVFGDFSLLFKFPTGPHDYGRLFTMSPAGSGLRSISELLVLPGGAISLALLGWGQDASGELYALGNIFGVPFGADGRVLKLVPAP